MTMTPVQIVEAYRAVEDLARNVLPYKASRQVARLKKRLAEENDVVCGAEKKIAEESGGKRKEAGVYEFPDAETNRQFQAALEEFRAQEDDVALPTVDLSKYTEMIRISPASIVALEGIVTFEKEGSADG